MFKKRQPSHFKQYDEHYRERGAGRPGYFKDQYWPEEGEKRKARQEALGMGGMAVDDNIIKLKDMSLDLELRTRPWNSRSYSDRADLLYQTLYRPFTKNV